MDPHQRIRSEFSRQSEQMASATAFQSADVLGRLVQALGRPPLGRVLDLACGPGIVTEAIAPLSKEVVGIDVTPKMVSLAASRLRKAGVLNCRFDVAEAEQLPFPVAHFDKVVTRLSLHHFPNPIAVLSEVRRVLNPEGRLVVADIVSSANSEEATLHNALERLRDPTHVRMLARRELLHLISTSGFEIVSEETCNQPRTFSEWAAIVADASRTEPLREVMMALARAGERSGIGLTESGGEVVFSHTWLLAVAQTAR